MKLDDEYLFWETFFTFEWRILFSEQRSRPSLSQRLGLPDESDQSDDEPYSPSDEQQFPSSTEQKIIRQPQASLRESTLISTGQPSKAILDLLQEDDEDEDEEEEEEEAYSPSQLDPATMDEVSDQLKGMKKSSTPTASVPPVLTSYIPPVPSQDDTDYRQKKKSK